MRGKSFTLSFVDYVNRHAPHATIRWFTVEYAFTYVPGPCPRATVYKCTGYTKSRVDVFRRSLYNDKADQAMVAWSILDAKGRNELLPELWDRCQRNRHNRHIPFWTAIIEKEKDHDT